MTAMRLMVCGLVACGVSVLAQAPEGRPRARDLGLAT
jgi:hypothetical protein